MTRSEQRELINLGIAARLAQLATETKQLRRMMNGASPIKVVVHRKPKAKLHWTQRPENRRKMLAQIRHANKVKRAAK